MSSSNSPIESIETYMNQAKQYPRLSAARETELSAIIRDTGSTPAEQDKAIEELVSANLRLVVKVAHDFKHCGLSFPDLVAEGNIGLMTAARRYDPAHGVRFGCYASIWIRQAIRAALSSKSRTIRLPTQCIGRLSKLNSAKDEFITAYNRVPTDEELSEVSGISTDAIEIIKHAATKVYSLDDKIKEDDDTTFGDMLGEQDDEHMRDQQYERVHDLLQRHIDKLPDMSRFVIEHYFGIEGKQRSIRQIGQMIGKSLNGTTETLHMAVAALKVALKRDGVRSSVA